MCAVTGRMVDARPVQVSFPSPLGVPAARRNDICPRPARSLGGSNIGGVAGVGFARSAGRCGVSGFLGLTSYPGKHIHYNYESGGYDTTRVGPAGRISERCSTSRWLLLHSRVRSRSSVRERWARMSGPRSFRVFVCGAVSGPSVQGPWAGKRGFIPLFVRSR